MDVNVTLFFSENIFGTDILQMSLAGIYFLWKKNCNFPGTTKKHAIV